MATGVKYVTVIPESVDQAVELDKGLIKNYLFSGVYVHDFVGKKHEHEGFIFLCLQGVTGGTTLGGEIAVVVLYPVRPATGSPTYRLVGYEKMTLSMEDVFIFLRNGDYKVVHRDDCGLI